MFRGIPDVLRVLHIDIWDKNRDASSRCSLLYVHHGQDDEWQYCNVCRHSEQSLSWDQQLPKIRSTNWMFFWFQRQTWTLWVHSIIRFIRSLTCYLQLHFAKVRHFFDGRNMPKTLTPFSPDDRRLMSQTTIDFAVSVELWWHWGQLKIHVQRRGGFWTCRHCRCFELNRPVREELGGAWPDAGK